MQHNQLVLADSCEDDPAELSTWNLLIILLPPTVKTILSLLGIYFVAHEASNIVARPSFMKVGSLILAALLCLSLLTSTEALTRRKARVRVVNNSGKDIEPKSIYIAHKYSSIYNNQLQFPKGLRNGEVDDAGGRAVVDYHTGFLTTGVDWWYVTWVFSAEKAIYQTDPNNFRCFIDEVEGYGDTILSAAAAAIAGVASCGFPPIAGCAAGPYTAAGAAYAAHALSSAVLNDAKTCGFKQYMLESEDDINEGAWVTISINRNNELTFSSLSGDASTVYEEIQVRPDGRIVIDEVKFTAARTAAAARAYGMKTPAAANKSNESVLLEQVV